MRGTLAGVLNSWRGSGWGGTAPGQASFAKHRRGGRGKLEGRNGRQDLGFSRAAEKVFVLAVPASECLQFTWTSS